MEKWINAQDHGSGCTYQKLTDSKHCRLNNSKKMLRFFTLCISVVHNLFVLFVIFIVLFDGELKIKSNKKNTLNRVYISSLKENDLPICMFYPLF